MAVLTATQLETLCRLASKKLAPVTYRKADIKAALQAVEDAAQSTSNVGNRSVKNHFGNAIETAAPTKFTAQQKDDIFVLWSRFNAERGGVL